MHAKVEKPKKNKKQSASNVHSQKQGMLESTFQFVDNKPEVVTQRKLTEMAKNGPRASQLKAYQEITHTRPQAKHTAPLQKMADYYSDQHQYRSVHEKMDRSQQNSISLKNKTSNKTVSQRQAIVQKKPTKKVSDKEIKTILARLEDVETRKELYSVAQRLIKDGSLWYDNSIKGTCAYPDPVRKIVMVTIPERLMFESRRGDAKIERDAITYHELTHAAEIVANTGGDFSNLKGDEMETKLIALDPICDELFNVLEREKDDYEAVPIKIESEPWVNLYELSLARINYAQTYIKHSMNPSSREFPTIIIQLIHFIGTKAPALKDGEFYQWLKILHMQAIQDRQSRKD